MTDAELDEMEKVANEMGVSASHFHRFHDAAELFVPAVIAELRASRAEVRRLREEKARRHRRHGICWSASSPPCNDCAALVAEGWEP